MRQTQYSTPIDCRIARPGSRDADGTGFAAGPTISRRGNSAEPFDRRRDDRAKRHVQRHASSARWNALDRAPRGALPLTSRDVLEFATLQGARACGLDHKTGSLTPGKDTDIVLTNTDSLHLIPMNNPNGAVVEFASAGDIDSIFVAGKLRKRGGDLLDLDFAAFRRRVDAQRDALFLRAGALTDGSWIVAPYAEYPRSEF